MHNKKAVALFVANWKQLEISSCVINIQRTFDQQSMSTFVLFFFNDKNCNMCKIHHSSPQESSSCPVGRILVEQIHSSWYQRRLRSSAGSVVQVQLESYHLRADWCPTTTLLCNEKHEKSLERCLGIPSTRQSPTARNLRRSVNCASSLGMVPDRLLLSRIRLYAVMGGASSVSLTKESAVTRSATSTREDRSSALLSVRLTNRCHITQLCGDGAHQLVVSQR